ncbi:hypothetical protein CPB83DRAFT_810869 [Crepidotus variabilis]|uniref:CID domain-containing protein n=1 Tax=Crepidotus variabilis TaxID=179855 RepID=A0A9P6JS64_9AGAR|nr:hypothetical protein CPB83DRAFT_810869 [Crepidotus variabilis]
MTAAEDFESLLKDVVNAKRLSASKMTALTDIALKNMEHDTQMVSILYRTHKSLTSATSKIFSLYAFDALCRAAKNHSTKHNISGDISTQPGNTSTFLLKVAGVVEGLFQDMTASGSQEAKEKTKKIFDIWVKGNTFPAVILAQLAEVLKSPEQVPLSKSSTPPITQPTTDPRMNTAPSAPPIIQTQTSTQPAQPAPMVDPQVALLALLTQAAATATQPSLSQFPMSGGTGGPQLAAQLAVLQQLAHTAAPVTSVPQSLTSADLVNVQKYPSSSGLNGSSRPPPEPFTMVRNEQRFNGYRSPEHESRTNPQFEDRDSSRGRYRGGFRGRGRGGRNWDERDRRNRDSERDDRSPPQPFRGGRSRSRSPLRNGERKATRFGSPTRRAREVSPSSSLSRIDASSGRQIEAGKDEFGRDVRPDSPSGSMASARNSPRPPLSPNRPDSSSADPRKLTPPTSLSAPVLTVPPVPPQHPVPNGTSIQPINPPKNLSNSNKKTSADTLEVGIGLESFNLAVFDYTAPTSWEALGKMWQVTNKTNPTQEQLLEFVMQCTANGGQPPINTTPQPSSRNFQPLGHGPTPSRGHGRGRGGFLSGRGGPSHGNGHFVQNDWGYDDGSQNTDAIVLGGGDVVVGAGGQTVPDITHFAPESQTSTPVGSSGRMKKIGDTWVFVRGTPMDVS